ncbi:MAG TPA: glycosyltransferase [Arcobacter sp.]|nr:glycosyltransferase [Arcobacter sp.]
MKNTKNIEISVITVCYNAEKTIEKTIESVINQNCESCEYIIIDGGSTDGTLNIINKYIDDINIVISEKDNGIAHAFNKGILNSSGSYINFLNADDYYEENVLNNMLDIIESGTMLAWGNTYTLNVNERKSHKKHHQKSICTSFPFSQCSLFYNKKYFEQFGIFNSQYTIAMDIDLLFRGFFKVKKQEFEFYISTQREGGVSDKYRLKGYIQYFNIAKKECGYLKSAYGFLYKLLSFVAYILKIRH